jgi:hypothetical protein
MLENSRLISNVTSMIYIKINPFGCDGKATIPSYALGALSPLEPAEIVSLTLSPKFCQETFLREGFSGTRGIVGYWDLV